VDGLDAFLEMYGVAAIFVTMLVKAAGVPIPIPSDVIMLAAAARAAEGKLSLGEAFLAIVLALVLGGIAQFEFVRGVGRGILYRFGRYLGLTQARLDAASDRVKRGGVLGISVAVFLPGIRSATVAACGLAGLPLRTFVLGLALGSAAFTAFHFTLGFVGSQVIFAIAGAVPSPWALLVLLLAVGFPAWILVRRHQRQHATDGEIAAEAFEAWQEATCPACLALGLAQSVRGRVARAGEGQ